MKQVYIFIRLQDERRSKSLISLIFFPPGIDIKHECQTNSKISIQILLIPTYHVISGNYYQIDIAAVERTCTSALV